MNLKEKELLNAISRTEKFSGYDAMSYFDDMDNFDGDEQSFADGMDDSFDYAGGRPQAMQVSDPYVISFIDERRALKARHVSWRLRLRYRRAERAPRAGSGLSGRGPHLSRRPTPCALWRPAGWRDCRLDPGWLRSPV